MRRFASLITVAVALTWSCSSSGPSADEQLVCLRLQEVIDLLARQDSQAAIDTMNLLHDAVARTANQELADAGQRFFTSLDTDVDRMQLTVEESVELGQRYAVEASGALGVVIDTCAAVGAEIERLPS